MPDTRKHRGPGPEDRVWFARENQPKLATAVAELSWLLSRGYAWASALKLVGDRHHLVERQRTAVLRSACSDTALESRHARQVEHEALRGKGLRIDGFNLILTLESALGGGVVLGGRDGCCRDLASVHGTYRRVEETRPALLLTAHWFREWEVGPCTWFFDAPVSNSGRLAAMVRGLETSWQAEVVADPDAVLVAPGDPVVTADAKILDGCGAWVNLARALIGAAVPTAFWVELGKAGSA